ncbi:MAG: DUF4340 domain-containing protein [Burkholderiales bacterium]|nr:DUF4340 domain-containing protein [Burkholderiales bacterium]
MNARVAAALVVLLVVLGGGALLVLQREGAERPGAAAALGQPLLKELKAAEVAAVVIRDAAGTITLERREDAWTIAERGGFPADIEKVREFVVKAIGLKVGQVEPLGEADRARLGLDDKGTRVEFRGADGKPLAALLVGKKHFKKEPDDPEKATADGRFVLRPDDPKTVYLVSDALSQATSKTAEWIDRRSFQVEKVKTLEVRHPEGDSWRIERASENAEWKLAPLKPGEKLEATRANSASYSLSLLDLADVATKDAAANAFERPILVDATTFDGLAYAIRVGRLEGENHYVAFTVSGAPIRERTPEKDEKPEERERRDKEHAERLKKLEERLAREKQLAQYVLLVPKSRLEDTLKKRTELLQKQDEKK